MTRKSPSQSATLYKEGTKKKGNDGNTWIISVNKNGVKRWKLYRKISSSLSPKNKSSNAKYNFIDLSFFETSGNYINEKSIEDYLSKYTNTSPNKIPLSQLKMKLVFSIVLISNYSNYSKFYPKRDPVSKYILKHKKSRLTEIIKNITAYKDMSFSWDYTNGYVTIEIDFNNPKLVNIFDIKKRIIQNMYEFFYADGRENDLSEHGPDTWMAGDITILEEDEYDENVYEIGLSLLKLGFNI